MNELIIGGATGLAVVGATGFGEFVKGLGSGVAKVLAERAFESRWIPEFFKGHDPAIVQKAESNEKAFFMHLAAKVHRLEEAQSVDRDVIARALSDPSFGALFHTALVGAAQTEEPLKHDLLASLIAGRLATDTNSTFAVASEMAASAVAKCTPHHIRILGYCASVGIRPGMLNDFTFSDRTEFVAACQQWIEIRFAPYVNLQIRPLDTLHLEAVSCLTPDAGYMTIIEILKANWSLRRANDTEPQFALSAEDLGQFEAGTEVMRIWHDTIARYHLTSVGELIGQLASDNLCHADATLFPEDWTS
jgi:hypothetical protein